MIRLNHKIQDHISPENPGLKPSLLCQPFFLEFTFFLLFAGVLLVTGKNEQEKI